MRALTASLKDLSGDGQLATKWPTSLHLKHFRGDRGAFADFRFQIALLLIFLEFAAVLRQFPKCASIEKCIKGINRGRDEGLFRFNDYGASNGIPLLFRH
jgi:hypothetical protein